MLYYEQSDGISPHFHLLLHLFGNLLLWVVFWFFYRSKSVKISAVHTLIRTSVRELIQHDHVYNITITSTAIVSVQYNNSFPQQICRRGRKTPGVTNNSINGFVLLMYVWVMTMWQWASPHNTGTLKLKQLEGFHFIIYTRALPPLCKRPTSTFFLVWDINLQNFSGWHWIKTWKLSSLCETTWGVCDALVRLFHHLLTFFPSQMNDMNEWMKSVCSTLKRWFVAIWEDQPQDPQDNLCC